jgi:ribosomal protein L11 methylase PrmA
MSQKGMLGLISNLVHTVKGLRWEPKETGWSGYYGATNYSAEAFEHKTSIVRSFLANVQPTRALDLGANTGEFSRLASGLGSFTVAFDIDPAAVEQNYLHLRSNKEDKLLPLVMDFTNPSPGLGWHNRERKSLQDRGPADALLALALIHHLAISNNVPLPLLAEYFAALGRWLVIEWVPKEDSQVQKLLASRLDIFAGYHQQGFETALSEFFTVHEKVPIQESPRTLYLMERK